MAPKRWGRPKAAVPVVPEQPLLEVRQQVLPLDEQDCKAVLLENYFSIEQCETYLRVLSEEIDWKQQEVAVARLPREDSTVKEPRMTLFMSDPGICYAYSGRDNPGMAWHPALLEVKKKVEEALSVCGEPSVLFNCVQLNRYNHPRHTLGLHKDNEPDLAKGQPIASVSFGAPREFFIRHGTNEREEYKVALCDGSFFLMAGAMQQKYLHGVPVGDRGLRFNLTFRVCIPRGHTRSGQAPEVPRSEPCGPGSVKAPLADWQPSKRLLQLEAKGKGKQSMERRIDPDDNKHYSFQDLLHKYRDRYKERVIFDYWRDECIATKP